MLGLMTDAIIYLCTYLVFDEAPKSKIKKNFYEKKNQTYVFSLVCV
jgi:hypothetical protein